MRINNLRTGLAASVLSTFLLLIQPVVLESQCVVTNTGMVTFPTLIIVTKTLSAPAMCTLTMMNASFCFPSYAPVNTPQLVASALTATVNPTCAWACDCGIGPPPHVTVDGSDGLPVELMDFSVEASRLGSSPHGMGSPAELTVGGPTAKVMSFVHDP